MQTAVLIAPSPGGLVTKKTLKFNRKFPPMSLLIIASLLRNSGWNIRLYDLNADSELSSDNVLKDARCADLVIFKTNPYADWQCPSYAIAPILEFARQLPSDRLIVIGNQGTVYPGGMLKQTGAWIVVRNEPEQTVADIAEAVANNKSVADIVGISIREGNSIRHNPPRSPVPLDDLPSPAYDLVNLKQYHYELLGGSFALMETSRGCPYSCSFCNQSMFQNRYRRRSADKVLQELDELIEVHGCRSLYIFDLEFALNRQMVEIVCRHLIKKDYAKRFGFRWTCQTRADSVNPDTLSLMKQSGCALIHFGVESGNSEILASTRKKISKDRIRAGFSAAKNAGIQTAGFFMFGLPGETPSTYRETLDFALELNPTYASFHPLLSMPGSPLYETKFGKSPYWDADVPVNISYFTPEQEKELARFVRTAYIRFYLRPEYVISLLTHGIGSDLLKKIKLFAGFALKR